MLDITDPFRPVLKERDGDVFPFAHVGVYSFIPGDNDSGKYGSSKYVWNLWAHHNTRPSYSEIPYGETLPGFKVKVEAQKLLPNVDYVFTVGGGGDGDLQFRILPKDDDYTIIVFSCPLGKTHEDCIAK